MTTYRTGFCLMGVVPDSSPWYGRAIRANNWATGYRKPPLRQMVHAANVCLAEDGEPYLVEASGAGVRRRPVSAADGRSPLWYALDLTPEGERAWASYSDALVANGTGYSWAGAAQFLLNIAPLPFVLPDNRDGYERLLICSRTTIETQEYVADLLGQQHWVVYRPSGKRLNEWEVAPADLGWHCRAGQYVP